jgi:hypothetical protein
LAQKLGIKAGHRVGLFGAPDGFTVEVPAGAVVATTPRGRFDVIVSFHTSRLQLEGRIPKLLDVHENVQRDIWLPLGLVDVKVCAIDEVWSGLRFCWRRDLRDSVRAGGAPRR